ncbi:MAG: FkbM family methyltransferase [Halieaceae bacterium]|jgi:FkbM family methyltransferase|nr:FkbM family methyltransferase [Halieaceae bacterium]
MNIGLTSRFAALIRGLYVRNLPYSDYLNRDFLKYIPRRKIDRIFELGARDGADGIALRDYFDADVTCFECNPHGVALCTVNLAGESRIRLVNRAVWDQNEEIDFYPVTSASLENGNAVFERYGKPFSNIGASSCFLTKNTYTQKYEQEKIKVQAVRLEDYCRDQNIDVIDLLCIDVQGAALHALRGLGKRITSVNYIIVELEVREIYHGQSLYQETHDYLCSHNFVEVCSVERDGWFSDFLFVRSEPRI